MSTTRDQLQLEPDQTQPPGRARRPVRNLWNWFGATFGIVVLVGASIIYLTNDATPAAEPVPDPTQDPGVAVGEPGSDGGTVEAPEDPGVDQAEGVIEIEMNEFDYSPDVLDIEAGVPIVLRFTNAGRLPHEAMVGDAHMQEEFAAAGGDRGHDPTDGHHGDLMAIFLEPGETADLEVVIDEAGTWYMACHLTGHYEQGQVATINVSG